jgi:membrane AbrB-like protein
VGTLVGVAGAVGGGGTLVGLPQVATPPGTNGLLQVSLGMLVGFRISRDELRSGARSLVPAALLTAIITSTGIAAALVAASLTSLDAVTAVFAAVPGGLTEMSAVSLSFGADGAAVASVQLVRVLLTVAAVDVLLAWLGPKKGSEDEETGSDSQEREHTPAESSGYTEDLRGLGIAVPWGILAGLAGNLSQVPAGGIIGALAASAAFRLLTGRRVPVRALQIGVQVLAGAVIGLQVSGEFFGQLARLAGAGAVIVSAQMLLWPLTGWMLARLFGYDLVTAILASTPGGLSGVVATASEAEADEVVVTFVHLVRLSTIVVLVPVLVALFFR